MPPAEVEEEEGEEEATGKSWRRACRGSYLREEAGEGGCGEWRETKRTPCLKPLAAAILRGGE